MYVCIIEDIRNLDLNLDDYDLDTEEINFDEVDEDLAKFQQDEIVKEALSKGVDLRSYSHSIENELKITEATCLEVGYNPNNPLITLITLGLILSV